MTSRLSLPNSLRTRPGDLTKDARNVNSYLEVKPSGPVLRKRPGVLGLDQNVGANPQMIGNIMESHSNIALVGSNSLVINETSNTTTAANWTSSTKTTDTGCVNVSPTVSFLSFRGNGLGQWYYRSVRWRIDYYNGSSWVAGSYRIVNMGAQTDTEVADTGTLTFPSAGAWQWRVYAESYDTDSTLFGTITYNYTQSTVYGTDISPGSYSNVAPNSVGLATYSNYSAPSGTDEIYEITYNATLSVTALSPGTTETFAHSVASWAAAGTFYQLKTDGTFHHVTSGNAVIGNKVVSTTLLQSSSPATWAPGAQSHTVTGSNLTFRSNYWAIGCERNFGGTVTVQVKQFITGMSAVVKRRAITSSNSTAVNNLYNVDSYSWVIEASGGGEITDVTKSAIYIVADSLSAIDLSAL